MKTRNDARAIRGGAGHLKRLLGVGFGLAVIVGSTIGVGILRTPGMVAGQLRTPGIILLVWLIGGLYTLLGSICLTELGTMLPLSGGYYAYARRAFGELVGFAVGWTDWLTYCAVLGYVSIGIGEFLGLLVPSLAGATTWVAIAALVGMVGMQWLGVRVSSRFQEWTTAIKFLAFLGIVVAAFTMHPGSEDPGLHLAAGAAGPDGAGGLQTPGLSFTGLILALQAVVIAYGGWQSALYFTEEDREPSRNLPRAMIGGLASVIVVYLLVNLALLTVLSIPQLATSKLPGADAAAILAGERGHQFLTLLSLISLLPLLNAIMMIGTRILFAMGRDGMVWSGTASVNAGGTPAVATVITTVVAVGLIATGTFETLIAMVAFFLAFNYCVCCVALVVLRRREPDLARPFRAWGYPWTAAIVVIGAIAFLGGELAGDTANAVKAIGLTGAGLLGRIVYARIARSAAANERRPASGS